MKSRSKLWDMIYGIISVGVRYLGIFVPKNPNKILFISNPDFSDNPRYLYEEIKKENLPVKCVWEVDSDKLTIRNLPKNKEGNIDVIVKYRSIKGLLHALTSKYIVTSWGTPLWKSHSQISINLWHGIPLKSMGFYLKSPGELNLREILDSKTQIKCQDYFVVSSPLVKLLFSSSFLIPPKQFIILGQPRCDALFEEKSVAIDRLSKMIDADPKKYFKIIFYIPTFRNNPNFMRKITEKIINSDSFKSFIQLHNYLFIFKPHHYNEKYFDNQKIHENIRTIKSDKLIKFGLTIYDVLPATDLLITDYSSIFFDYLLTNNPIVFYIPDFDNYREKRGFLLEPYDFWTPGEKTKNVLGLITAIKNSLSAPDKYKKNREIIRDLMFTHQDRNSAERIINYFWKDLKK